MTIRLAVFDCDGTLVDGQHAIIAAMRESFERAGVQPPDASAVRRIVGLPLEDAVTRLSMDSDLA
ncbi:MAG: HAD hydrolase-like protein, partial [Alphaproteobacteria bacterium]